MQQMMSFVGFAPTAQGPAQAAPGPAAASTPAGLFQQLLEGAILGGAPMVAMPAQPLQLPNVPMQPMQSNRAMQPNQAMQPVQPGEPSPQQQPTPIPIDPAVMPLAGKLLTEPLKTPAPQTPAPQIPVVAVLTPQETPAEGEMPAEPGALDEDLAEGDQPAMDGAVQVALVAASAAQAVPAPPQPMAVTPNPAPQPSSRPNLVEAPPGAVTDQDPAVQRFVQQAVAQMTQQQGESNSSAPPEPKEQGPTFGDLIDLVQGAGVPDADRPHMKREAKVHANHKEASAGIELKREPAPPELTEAQSDQPLVVEARPQPVTRENAHAPQEAPEVQRQPVDPESVVRQVTRSVKVMLDGKRSEIQMQLSPEHLGKVAVRLVLNEGSVQANITAKDASVRAALESGLEQLKVRFLEQGLKVEHVHVSVGSDSSFTQFQHSSQEQPRQQGQHGQATGRQQPWRARQEAEPQGQEPPTRPPTPRMWGYGRTGARINSLA